MFYVLPLDENATTETIRPAMYNEWQQTRGAFDDMFWLNFEVLSQFSNICLGLKMIIGKCYWLYPTLG